MCGHRRHTLRTARLLLYSPESWLDLAAALAAASDPEAQHWLGWEEERVLGEQAREALLALRPGDTDALRSSARIHRLLAHPIEPGPDIVPLIGVRTDDGRYAGVIEMDPGSGQVTGWLAPHARDQAFAAELFGAAALLGHAHLGLRTVRAAYDPRHAETAQALSAARFVPDDSPPHHTLPNGREVDIRWVRHTAPAPTTRCRGAAPPPATRTEAAPANEH
ncbi:GNAT family N-acetyltransferase [Streptomyces sp. NPDC007901]|uniref:GNAT family N-acetyltransferase n=1 Tax=Streptomyces sp. NPDC007901 TaxID=3364785 RepID=UPI0036E44DAB